MRGAVPASLARRAHGRPSRVRSATAAAGSSGDGQAGVPPPMRGGRDAAAAGAPAPTTTTTTTPLPLLRPTPKGVPRLVSDADLLLSLRGEDGGGLASRAFAPPAEPRVCRCCAGTATVPCPACGGSGRLPAGGYRATNPVLMPKIVGTQWTAAERTLGRTHFRCAAKRRASSSGGGEGEAKSGGHSGGGGQWFVLMVAACDESIRLWVDARALRDRSRWTPGWVTVADVVERRSKKDGRGVGPRSGAGCKACSGEGRAPCPLCTRPGEVIEL
jgi:hypothetical protein